MVHTSGRPEHRKRGRVTKDHFKHPKKYWFHVPEKAKGSLTKLGYHPEKSELTRHHALKRAIDMYGKTTVLRKLHAIANVTKHSQPRNSARYKADAKWVSHHG